MQTVTSDVRVAIIAEVQQYLDGMKAAAGATTNASVAIKQEMASLGTASKEARAPLVGLTDSLKDWRQHVRTEARYTNFMAAQIAGLGIASKGAAAELTGLVSAFAFGNGLGLGIEIVKQVVHGFLSMAEAEDAAKEE